MSTVFKGCNAKIAGSPSGFVLVIFKKKTGLMHSWSLDQLARNSPRTSSALLSGLCRVFDGYPLWTYIVRIMDIR